MSPRVLVGGDRNSGRIKGILKKKGVKKLIKVALIDEEGEVEVESINRIEGGRGGGRSRDRGV